MRNPPTYEQYCHAVHATFDDQIVAFPIPGALGKFLTSVKEWVQTLISEAKVGIKDIIKAFTSKDVFKILAAIGFNLGKLFTAFQKLAGLAKSGLLVAFEKAEKAGWLKKLKEGTAKVDEFLDQYPVLKKLAGPVFGALLLYGSMNGTFVGNLSVDLDISSALAAFAGHFTLQDMLATPDGLATFTLIVLGLTTGISVTYLASSVHTTFLALLYTGAKKAGASDLAKKVHLMLQHKVKSSFKEIAMKTLAIKAAPFQQDADDESTYPSGVKISAGAIKVADRISLSLGFEDRSMAHHMSVGLIAYILTDLRYKDLNVAEFRKALKLNTPLLKKVLTKIGEESTGGAGSVGIKLAKE